eukprot:CAMPEP_0113320656 /NCGR_PEP_ID=MMETSP0010_2-20120614/14400_1 /TAXON_ID=216773 ORGANISM="Corethron hystrix, Strain 308" /NCGR_SAMPLE_ID=MMETSP0010_2 /ASSEMBLY_ACC=CAM_ASM_000155 /LENGTH=330 /DNA_ID=CAMNT_0000178527 /DNA_START=72 /DNA_END=1061 /DNA_ORIENTATION=- /assembly_acc=CAM_ASM_000155
MRSLPLLIFFKVVSRNNAATKTSAFSVVSKSKEHRCLSRNNRCTLPPIGTPGPDDCLEVPLVVSPGTDGTGIRARTTSLSLSARGGDTSPSTPSPPKVRVGGDIPLLRELLAETLGTFLIVHLGCGTVCSAIFTASQTGLWQIAAVWSLAVTVAIAVTGSVSGAHLNPAVTLALALLRGFRWRKALAFVGAQVAGAAAAAACNLALYEEKIAIFEAGQGIIRGSTASVASAKAFGEYWSVSSWKSAFFAEALGTAVLAFVVFSVTNSKNKTTSEHPMMIPPVIGATVGALISVIAPLTQAGFNPARDFGPRIISALGGWGWGVAMKGWWL